MTVTPEDLRRRRGVAAVTRLAKLNGSGKYKLGAGGTNPNSPTPHTWRDGVYGSDCVGAVMWALEAPRAHKDFPEYYDAKRKVGDINTDSMLMDAALYPGGKGLGRFFRAVAKENVFVGCLVVFPSIFAREVRDVFPVDKYPGSYRARVGHVGMVAGWDGLVDPTKPYVEDPSVEGVKWNGDMHSLVTVECCASTPAIRLRRNVNFIDGTHFRGHTNAQWGVKFVAYVGP